TCTSMIARGYSIPNLVLSLGLRHAGIDALDNLFFCEAGIFQMSDRRTAERRAPLQAAMQHELQSRIGKSDKPESHELSADGIQLIGLGDFQNLRFRVPCVCEVGGGIPADKRMLPFVRRRDERDAGIVAQVHSLRLNELADFRVGSVEGLELLETAGPHASVVE